MRKFRHSRLVFLSVSLIGASMLIQNAAMGVMPAASTGVNPALNRAVTSTDSGANANTVGSISARGENLNRATGDDTDTPSGQWRPGVRGPKRHYEEVMPGQLPCSGREMLYREHVDATYATYDKGKLAIKLVDGSDVRDSSEVCLRLPEDADAQGQEISRMVVPQGKQWRFLGNPGAIVWYAPQFNNDGNAAPIWAGLGAFDNAHEWKLPEGVDQGLVTLRLVEVVTPSEKVLTPKNHTGKEQLNIFAMIDSNNPDKMISTNMGIWDYKAGVGSHTHANWTFSAPGYWRLRWQAEMTVNGKKQVSPVAEQIWAVGSNKDLMLKGETMEGTKSIGQSAEALRKSKGIKAPKEDGFDYYGEQNQDNAYTPANSLDKLVPPTKPTLPKKLDDPSESALKAIYDGQMDGWANRTEFNAKNYLFLGFNDKATITDSTVYGNTRLRLFSEKTTEAEKKKIFAPLVLSEANGYSPQEPITDNTYYAGESDKIIPVPDQYLTVYEPDTFKNAGDYRDKLEGSQVYAFDQRDPQSSQFAITLPADKEGLIKDAVVYIEDGENDTKVAMGTFATDPKTGKDTWTTLTSGGESNRRSFVIKPGETKPLSLIFNKPGVAKVTVNYKINYKDEKEDSHPGPAQDDFRFLVGSKTINHWRDWDAKNNAAHTSEREKVVTEPRPSIGYYAQYKADYAKYEAKKAELEKKKKDKPQNLGPLYRKVHDAEVAKDKLAARLAEFLTPFAGGAGGSTTTAGGIKYSPAGSTLLAGWNSSSAAKKDKAAGASGDKADTNAAANPLPASVSGAEAISSAAKTAATAAQSPLIWMLIGAGVMAMLIGLGMIGYVLLAGRKR